MFRNIPLSHPLHRNLLHFRLLLRRFVVSLVPLTDTPDFTSHPQLLPEGTLAVRCHNRVWNSDPLLPASRGETSARARPG
jgi:hypothetical protein